jgi:ATP-dependent DNA helicase RecG
VIATVDFHQQKVNSLRGVGPQLAARLNKLGLYSIQDLLFHLPMRYIDRTQITPIGGVQAQTEVVIEGQILASDVVFGRRRSLVCRLQDGSGTTTLRFFHFSRAQQERLKAGTKLRCFGEARRGKLGVEFYHPEYLHLDDAETQHLEKTLTPIYPATEGITQNRLRDLCGQAVKLLDQYKIPELLPTMTDNPLASQLSFSLTDAVKLLHHPPPGTALGLLANGEHPAQQRLAIEELIAHNLSLLRVREKIQAQPATVLPEDKSATNALLAALPFHLTEAQIRVYEEISRDINSSQPMLRLVQGDVGSGKTIVAALAALQTIASGHQAVLMAPTEILAEQHRVNFEQWFKPLNIQIGWLTGKVKGKARDIQLNAIANGKAKMVIGTHALFQEGVAFDNLALSIIDEQHRFGVHQRLALRQKGSGSGDSGNVPHQLIMTATPIPRTLAMSAYADLDCSVIDQLPPGRKSVTTIALNDIRRNDLIQRVRAACASGRQAYWVCTLIEESDVLEAQAAEVTASELQLLLPELSVGLIHGRLKPRDKHQIMQDFKTGTIDLLVATTVIEVGVDVPNASLMIIENAERLGLSQLHQLRGRVGRGSEASHCLLLYSHPLSNNGSARLKIMRETSDGFKIAEKDLELRGPGEILGTRQTGDLQLRIADLRRDGHLLPAIKPISQYLLLNQPNTVDHLIRRWLGHSDKYAQA